MQENTSYVDQACIGAAMVPGASVAQLKGCISFDSGHAAKLEKADQCAHPKSDTEQQFSSDSLSMAQSKLLEDWRPEPLEHQSCPSDSYASSGSSALGKFWCKAPIHCFTCLGLLLKSNFWCLCFWKSHLVFYGINHGSAYVGYLDFPPFFFLVMLPLYLYIIGIT